MNIRLTHLDGKLPNLALMKLSHWHKQNGDNVFLSKQSRPTIREKKYNIVYGSSIFKFSQKGLLTLRGWYPDAVIGGTGSDSFVTVEESIKETEYEFYDYSIYPDYPFSIGFTQRGCRLNCGFCVVPKKEGRPKSINTIYDIWRKNDNRCIVLLDNDFFGQPKNQWMERIQEIIDGKFKVSFNQGINIRLIDDESAYWISKIPYYDDQFKVKRLYTAWDNLKDEKIFFDGVDRLIRNGVSPKHLLVYMLVGYRKDETWEEIFYRFNKMVEIGIRPYPMIYNNKDKELRRFQRWVVRRYYEFIPWSDFK